MAPVRSALVTTVALASAALLATGSAFATSAATPVFAYTGGSAVPVGDVLTASTSQVQITSTSGGSTGITCNSSTFSGPVTANSDANDHGTLSVESFTIGGSCSSNITGVTGVKSLTAGNLPYSATVAHDGATAVTGSISVSAELSTLLGSVTCTYTGSTLSGTAGADQISFSNQHFAKSSGSALCPGDAYFNAVYSPVTGPGGTVTLG